ncbi:MAG: glycosyltransferase [Mogibacterium sp.]|nr:glycosyltransferase [Mogibacterium sp.]
MTNKILLTGYIPGINGISTHIHNIYSHLDRNRYDYIFVIPEKHRDDKEEFKRLKDLDAEIVFLNYSKKDFPKDGRRELKRIMKETPNICGVHAHDVNRSIYPLLLADSLDLPVKIIQFHAGTSRHMLECIEKNPAEREGIERIGGARFCRLACSDLSGRAAYGDLPFEVFPNAVDCKRFAPNLLYRKITREKLDIPLDSHVLGFAGYLAEVKNPFFAAEVFVRVHERQPDTHMIICGYGKLFDKLRDFFKEKNLLEYVHFTGEHPQMEFFYNAMDVFLVPSLFEGLPNTVMEAQASGLPCLVSDRMTEMVCTTDLVKQLSLTEMSDRWVDEAIRLFDERRERRSYEPELKKAGFEICDAVEKLMQIYDNQRCFNMRSSTS